jgi:single-strand DNA-binding protein
MKDVNRVFLIGRVGADPERKETRTGIPLLRFSLATGRRVRDPNASDGSGWSEETDWHRIVLWGKLAEALSQHIRKGEKLFVEGTLKVQKYTAKDGTSRSSFEVHAEDVTLLGGSSRSAQRRQRVEAAAAEESLEVAEDIA